MTEWEFYITNTSSVSTEVFPLNWLECSLVDEKEKDSVFYRRKFNGDLTFGGKKHCADFNLFYAYEQSDPCEILYFEIWRDGVLFWEGYFSTSDGDWDLDNQTFTVSPMVLDKYTDWDVYGDDLFNILLVTPTVTTSVVMPTVTYTYTRNRWLMDVIEYLVNEIFPTATVESDLFTSDWNYVTDTANYYNHLTIADKSDIKFPTSSDAAAFEYLSFNGLMHILKMFNVRWEYDDATNVFTLEHVSWWDATAGIDLRGRVLTESTNKYSYDKSNMPSQEQFDFMEAEDNNYATHVISYKSPCTNQDKESNIEQYINNVTTDIEYIQRNVADPDYLGSSISNDGFVILANYEDGGLYYVYKASAYESAQSSYNVYLSWSYLLRAFYRHDRTLLTGYIQGTAINFISAKKIKIQEISAIVCKEELYEPDEYITTELGETYFNSEKGYVKRAVLKPYGEINFTLQYGPDTNDDAVMPDPLKTIHLYVSCGSPSSYEVYLSEANLYDSYFWIWIDETTCQDIIIPAGTTYQTGALDADCVDENADIKVNMNDSSFDGWYWTYNETGDPPNPCNDGDCGGGVIPPAIPGDPTLDSVTQAHTCATIVVSYTPADVNATYYEVYRKVGTGSYSLIGTSLTTTYNDHSGGMNWEWHGGTLWYKVKACNISGCSGYSNELSIVLDCTME